MNLKTLLRLIDPRTLVASLIPVVYGSISAWYLYDQFHPLFFLLMLLGLLLVQSSANMFNDLSDFSRAADDKAKGNEKALVNGEVTSRAVEKLLILFMGLAFVIAVILSILTSIKILLPVILGAFVLYLYSSGPKPICYTPFGEITAGLTMGMLATETIIYIQSGVLNGVTLLFALPTTCFIGMLLLSNNLSDWQEDRAAGRKTLPILLGVKTAENVWVGLLFIQYSTFLLLAFFHFIPLVGAAISLAFFPFPALKMIFQTEKRNQNKPVLMKLAGSVGLRFHGIMCLIMIILKMFIQHINILTLGFFNF